MRLASNGASDGRGDSVTWNLPDCSVSVTVLFSDISQSVAAKDLLKLWGAVG